MADHDEHRKEVEMNHPHEHHTAKAESVTESVESSPRFNSFLEVILACVPTKMQYFFQFQIDSSLPDSGWIEDVGSLPKFWKYFVGVIFNLAYYAVLIYFLVTAYHSGRTSTFISLDAGAGDCTEVGRPTFGNFRISSYKQPGLNGSSYKWSTSSGFNYNTSYYSLQLQSYTNTQHGFREQMAYTEGRIRDMGDYGSTRDMAWNLEAWMTFNFKNVTDSTGVFEFALEGVPKAIFDTPLTMVAIANHDGPCDAAVNLDFDKASTSFTVTLPNYMSSQTCMSQLDASKLAPIPISSKSIPVDLKFQIDMRAFALAAAINIGIVDLDTLVPLKYDKTDDDYVTHGGTDGGGGGGDNGGNPYGDDGGLAPNSCPKYDITAPTNSASDADAVSKCTVPVCNGQTLVIGNCQDTSSCVGDQFIRLFDYQNNEVASNDDACQTCSQITYTSNVEGCTNYVLYEGCFSQGNCKGQMRYEITGEPIAPTVPVPEPTAAPTVGGLTAGEHYAVTNTASATVDYANMTVMNLCQNDELVIGNCFDTSTCIGDQYIRLFDLTDTEVAFNDDSRCGTCSELTYTRTDPGCDNYYLKEGCYNNNYCEGTMSYQINARRRLDETPVVVKRSGKRSKEAEEIRAFLGIDVDGLNAKFGIEPMKSVPAEFDKEAYLHHRNLRQKEERATKPVPLELHERELLEQETISKVNWEVHGRALNMAGNVSGNFVAYYDRSTKFLGMEPIYCFLYTEGGQTCFLLIENVLALPVLNSFGSNDLTSMVNSFFASSIDPGTGQWNVIPPDWSSMSCNCSTPWTPQTLASCNAFTHLMSLVFFPTDGTLDMSGETDLYAFRKTINFAHKLQLQMDEHGEQADVYMKSLVYAPSITGIYQQFGMDFTGATQTAMDTSKPFRSVYPDVFDALCRNCTIISLVGVNPSNIINEYAASLDFGTCFQSMWDPNFHQIVNKPPLQLVERYYECVLTIWEAGFQALGLSMGNADVFTMVFISLVCILVSRFVRKSFGYRDNVFEDYAPENHNDRSLKHLKHNYSNLKNDYNILQHEFKGLVAFMKEESARNNNVNATHFLSNLESHIHVRSELDSHSHTDVHPHPPPPIIVSPSQVSYAPVGGTEPDV